MTLSHGQFNGSQPSSRQAFSLVELVMVIAIIAVLGAIAVPRLTKASQRAQANALSSTLTNVRKAIDQYYAEHSRYPGYDPSNLTPDGDFFVDQLTLYSGAGGKVSTTRNTTYKFGPYLSKPFPTNPANGLSTVHVKAKAADAVPLRTTGWHACLEDGTFGLNSTAGDMEALKIDVEILAGILELAK